MTMRILSNKWHGKALWPIRNLIRSGGHYLVAKHVMETNTISFSRFIVYAGLAILNPSAKAQVRQYSLSVAALFKLMIQEKEEEFVARIRAVCSYLPLVSNSLCCDTNGSVLFFLKVKTNIPPWNAIRSTNIK